MQHAIASTSLASSACYHQGQLAYVSSSLPNNLEERREMEEGASGGGSRGGRSKKFKDDVVGDGSGGSSSKRKISGDKDMYVGDGGIPFGKRARYRYPEDSEVMQVMYSLSTFGELVSLVESTREKDDDIVSPNLRFTYGVKPFSRDSDPRIGNMARQKQQVLQMMRSNDRAAKMRRPEGSYLAPSACMVIEAIRTRGGQPDFKFPVPKGNEEEIWRIKYEKWEEQEEELLRSCDLRMATRGLACFNLKFKTDYMVEEVLGSQKIDLEQNLFYHCNFTARSKKGSRQRLFFTEIRNAVEVSLCCILDDGVRGCNFCGDEFVHPSEGGLQRAGG